MAFPVFGGRDRLPAIGFCPQTEWQGPEPGDLLEEAGALLWACETGQNAV